MVPGGILADRVNSRTLLTFSLVVTGIAGLFFATFPPFHMSMAVSVVWGISTILTFWAAPHQSDAQLGPGGRARPRVWYSRER